MITKKELLKMLDRYDSEEPIFFGVSLGQGADCIELTGLQHKKVKICSCGFHEIHNDESLDYDFKAVILI